MAMTILILLLLLHLSGAVAAFYAIQKARTPQAAVGWALALIGLPYLSIPIFLVFGHHKYISYSRSKRRRKSKLKELHDRLNHNTLDLRQDPVDNAGRVASRLIGTPTTVGNKVSLLINGGETFEAIYQEMEKATSYICFQFYTVEDGDLFDRFFELFKRKVAEGVGVYFLADKIGSTGLSNRSLRRLKKIGVSFGIFGSGKLYSGRFQINFRNHRKIVVVDGRTAFIGGLNVGDSYIHQNEGIGFWRDTHIQIWGPAVLYIQKCFVEDWHWATKKILNLSWEAQPVEGSNVPMVILPMGPADKHETCALNSINCIDSAKKRLWLATPYFVPDRQALTALQLAAIRGVDVRVIMPKRADHRIVDWVGLSFLSEMLPLGIRVFRYTEGFMHQKVMLADDTFGMVGSANFDNRSFRLNFEINALAWDREFNQALEKMLLTDFALSDELFVKDLPEIQKQRWLHTMARLFSPIL